jgi:arginase family enzyme
MEIKSFFKPVNLNNEDFKTGFLGNTTLFDYQNFKEEDFREFDLAIIGVPEERNAFNNKGTFKGSKQFRKYFYHHSEGPYKTKIIDLGDFVIGATVEDTYTGLAIVIAELLKLKVLPIIIGGSQDLTFANFKAYEHLEQLVNIVTIDNSFDLGDVGDPLKSNSYLNKIVLHQPNYLFNYSNLGYQTYFVTQEEIDLMGKLHFDICRLGEIRADLTEAEPIIRNADMASFDLSSIRNSDAPANNNVTPNGFYGEEVCKLARYAGLSDNLTSVGFYELNPEIDDRGQTAHLLAQIVWYFIDGFYHRKNEIPERDNKEFLKYVINSETHTTDLIFFKNLKTDRWWMDIPHPKNSVLKFKRHQFVPCSYKDYLIACKDEMPERWLKTFQKLV